jgi:hypothetical protein
MSIMESIGIFVGGASLVLVALSMARNSLTNEDFKSAWKHVFDSSKSISELSKSYTKVIEIVLEDTMPFAKYNKRVVLLINSSLISAISTVSKKGEGESVETRRSNTVVGVMLLERLKKSTKIQLTLIVCLIVNFALSLLPGIEFSNFLFALVSSLIFAIHLDQNLIEYRIKKGWYGTNEFEAKEIINFIISHSNKDDFNDSGGLKRVIPLPDVEAENEKAKRFDGATV